MVFLQVYRHASVLICFILICNVSANCYWPNGTDRNAGLSANLYSPCGPSTSASMCCAQDPSSPFLNDRSGVDCRSDGLCADAGNNALWRTACTDYSWQSPECIKLCINGTNEAGNDIQVMQCSDGSYCCGGRLYSDIASHCCSGGHGSVWIVDGEETSVNPNLSTAPSRVPSAKTWYSPASPSVQPPGKVTVSEVVSSASQPTRVVSSPAKADNNGNRVAKIEGGVLGVFGLALILGACWFVSGRMRRKRPRAPPAELP